MSERVLIAGLGGVGSFALEVLARCGVEELTLVDFDCIESSNLNRQLFALHSTLGVPKVELAAERVRDIAPNCKVRVMAQRISTLPDGDFDVVVDAIDSLAEKAELIASCIRRGIPVVSSMGAARRRDPTKICVGSFAQVTGDPLAKTLKKRYLPEDIIANDSWRCVWSKEKAAPCGEGAALWSWAPVTAAFGLVAGNETLRLLRCF